MEQAIGAPSEYPKYMTLHLEYDDGKQAKPDIHYIKRGPHSYWETDTTPDESGSEEQQETSD